MDAQNRLTQQLGHRQYRNLKSVAIRCGTLSVVISSSIGEFFNRSSPCSVIKLCVTAALISASPRAISTAAALVKRARGRGQIVHQQTHSGLQHHRPH
jgi:hypothetical protein